MKTRFVDRDTGYRLFESKSPDLRDVRSGDIPEFDEYDVVLIADFGHGIIDARVINARTLERRRSFVAAMAQVNSTNYGYNLPTKFEGLDYCSVNRTEAELCLQERGLPLRDLLDRMTRLLNVPALSVTDGEHGAMVLTSSGVFAIPTVSTSVVDTVGCGDAYLRIEQPRGWSGLPGGNHRAGREHRCGGGRTTSRKRAGHLGSGISHHWQDCHLTSKRGPVI